MVILLLLLSPALAQDIPAKPESRPAVENQCVEATPVTEPCSAVAVPTSEVADMLDIEIWGEGLYKHYEIDQAAWALREDSLLTENKNLKRGIWIRSAEALVIGFAAGYITYHAIESR